MLILSAALVVFGDEGGYCCRNWFSLLGCSSTLITRGWEVRGGLAGL